MTAKKMYGFYRPHRAVNYTGELVNHKTGEVFTPPSMTKQSFVKECDINNILKEYKVTGQVRHMRANADAGAYQDLGEPVEFQEAIHTVMAAQEAFATLPAQVRRRFDNDPAEFLAFMADPRNGEEIIKMGLGSARPGQAPVVGSQPPKTPSGEGGPPKAGVGGSPPTDAQA